MSKEVKVDMATFKGSSRMIKYISDLENQSIKETLDDIKYGDIFITSNQLAFALNVYYDEPVKLGLGIEENQDEDLVDRAILMLEFVILKEMRVAYTYLDEDGTRYYIKRKDV